MKTKTQRRILLVYILNTPPRAKSCLYMSMRRVCHMIHFDKAFIVLIDKALATLLARSAGILDGRQAQSLDKLCELRLK